MTEIKQQIVEALAKHGVHVGELDIQDQTIAEQLLSALTRPDVKSVTLDDKDGLVVNFKTEDEQ